MNRKKAELRPANLFLIELTVTLLFFALSAAVILKVFAVADDKQRLSTLTERSVICAQSLAEAYSVSGDVTFALSEVFGDGVTLSGDVLTLDSSFQPSFDAEVTLTLTEERVLSEAGTLKKLNISFSAEERALLDISCAAYLPDHGGAVDG